MRRIIGSRSRTGGLVLAATLAVVAATVGASGVAAAPAGPGHPVALPAGVAPAGVARTVTLITGDRVEVTVVGTAVTLRRVVPGPGRGHIAFAGTQFRGDVRVVPSDAAALLHAGRLDPRLFDVTTLVGFGYDNRRGDLPLIVTGTAATVPGRLRSLTGAGAVRALPVGGALRVATAQLSPLWTQLAGGLRAAVPAWSKIWLDGIRRPSLDVSVPLIGGPAAWAAGYTGTGVTVGVVDTGIDATHPDLTGQVVAAEDFSGSGDTLDHVGHGTHVAATIASHDSRYRGVAPGARLLSAKACADLGCSDSAILAGMEWAAEHGAKIINMSLGGADTPDVDPLEAAVADLTARFGILFVIAAGNDGADQSIESPGSADAALTVAATTKTDELAGFSSRGPRLADGAVKPDIAAPGVDIVAARSRDGVLGVPGDLHLTLSGTSMATPHVAGSAAVLLQEHPQWTPAQLKAALMGSARTLPGLDPFAQGAGRVDVARAITQTVVADPPSVSFGRQEWPHTDDTPDHRTVTYTNTGPTAVTLDLSLGAVPAGLFTLSTDHVTVPAGGSAPVTITSDTRVDIADARYTGNLVATAGAARITTPFAVDKERESHTLVVHTVDRAGHATENFFAGVVNLDTGLFLSPVVNDQPLRAPVGRYAVIAGVFDDAPSATMLAEPALTLDRDRTVTMDARDGRPVDVTVGLPGLAPVFLIAAADAATPVGDLIGLVFGPPDTPALYAGSPAPHHTDPSFHGLIAGLYARDGTDPATARVMWHQNGRMFSGFTAHVTRSSWATVHTGHTADRPVTGFLNARASWPDGYVSGLAPGAPVDVPGSGTEYYNTDGGVSWIRTLQLSDVDDPSTGSVLVSPVTRFLGGHEYTEERNRPVTGPGFTPVGGPGWINRRGDTITVFPVLLNDRLDWYGVPQAGDAVDLTLDRDGTRIFDGSTATAVDVPAASARYRLGQTVTRRGFTGLSTSVSAVWTFRSGTAPTAGRALPLSVVRFAPAVDATGTARAGRPFLVPVHVEAQPGSSAGPVRTLTVEVSYDDGATWHPAPLVRHGADGVVALRHPGGPGFVSLRARSSDTAGNTVEQTVIRAYHIA